VLFVAGKVVRASGDEVFTMRTRVKSYFAIVFAEFVGLIVLYIFEMKLCIHEEFIDSFTLFFRIAFWCVVVLAFFLHCVYSFAKTPLSVRQKTLISFSLTALTAPYLFLVLSP